MFFEKEILSFCILDVLELKQEHVNKCNIGRNFNALSFRLHSDAVLRTEKSEHLMKDNFVSYVPAGLNYQRIAAKDELIAIHFSTADYYAKTIECFEAKNPSTLTNLFLDILSCWNKKDLGYKYRCSAILYEIFEECYIQNGVSEFKNSKIKASVEYLLKNYKNSSLTIKEIAGQSFISEVYFRKLFKEEYGVSPQKFIMNLRIQNAISLISMGYYSLKEIAYLSGYHDYKYFSTEFKKTTGTSPSKYPAV